MFFLLVGSLLALDVAQRLHGLHGGEGGGLHHAGALAELFLRQAVGLPEDAQESPVAEGHAVLRQPHLQRAVEGA
jgi:hypothetical protein